MHLSTHQDISLGQKIVHVHHLEKHLMGQVDCTFLGKKEHQLICCNQKWFRVEQHSCHKYSEDKVKGCSDGSHTSTNHWKWLWKESQHC